MNIPNDIKLYRINYFFVELAELCICSRKLRCRRDIQPPAVFIHGTGCGAWPKPAGRNEQHAGFAGTVGVACSNSQHIGYGNLTQALIQPDTDLRLFGKPEVQGERRMGVALALGDNVDHAKQKALDVIAKIKVDLL